jgi:acyl-CoA thioester hydrolase
MGRQTMQASTSGERTAPKTGSWRRRHVYLLHVRVRYHELDPLGHVNNAVYLNWLEQAAIEHAEAAGWGAARLAELGGAFVARRHEVDYLRPAVAGDVLRVATWAEALDGARALRAYEIVRFGGFMPGEPLPPDGLMDPDAVPDAGEVLVRARTVWTYVNLTTGRPRRVPPGLREDFQVSAAGERLTRPTGRFPILRDRP